MKMHQISEHYDEKVSLTGSLSSRKSTKANTYSSNNQKQQLRHCSCKRGQHITDILDLNEQANTVLEAEEGRKEKNNIYWKRDLLKKVVLRYFKLKNVGEKKWNEHVKKMQHLLLVLHFLSGKSLLYSTDFKTCLRFHRFSITSIMVHNEIPGSSKKKRFHDRTAQDMDMGPFVQIYW